MAITCSCHWCWQGLDDHEFTGDMRNSANSFLDNVQKVKYNKSLYSTMNRMKIRNQPKSLYDISKERQ